MREVAEEELLLVHKDLRELEEMVVEAMADHLLQDLREQMV
jgi:hypothetical protein